MYEQAITGNSQAVELLLESVNKRLQNMQFRLSQAVLVRGAREDVVQATLVRVYEALISGKLQTVSETEFNQWVRKQATNAARAISKAATYSKRDVRREVSRDFFDESGDVAANDISIEDQVDNGDMVSELFSIVKRADDRAILLGIMEGLSYASIAEGLGVQVNRIYWRVKYLRTVASRVAL